MEKIVNLPTLVFLKIFSFFHNLFLIIDKVEKAKPNLYRQYSYKKVLTLKGFKYRVQTLLENQENELKIGTIGYTSDKDKIKQIVKSQDNNTSQDTIFVLNEEKPEYILINKDLNTSQIY